MTDGVKEYKEYIQRLEKKVKEQDDMITWLCFRIAEPDVFIESTPELFYHCSALNIHDPESWRIVAHYKAHIND